MATRTELVDFFFDTFPEQFKGDRTYWYEARGEEDKDFIAAFQVFYVSAGVITASRTITIGIDWTGIALIARIANFQDTLAGKEIAVACIPGRHDAIEHVNTANHPGNDVLWAANTHQVAWAVPGQFR